MAGTSQLSLEARTHEAFSKTIGPPAQIPSTGLGAKFGPKRGPVLGWGLEQRSHLREGSSSTPLFFSWGNGLFDSPDAHLHFRPLNIGSWIRNIRYLHYTAIPAGITEELGY
jgi:hypothetical protein